jgi:SAM-dependent methyltransferase
MYAKTAQYYDRIYAFKDYAAEAAKILEIVDRDLDTSERRLLDVACGTGLHLEHLKPHFEAEGLDLEPALLEIARARHPELTFHQADMRTFTLDARYDVITCLFSSIGYMTTIDDLHRAIARMAVHLRAGGLLLIEPWFPPEAWHPNTVHGLFIDDPELKLARVNTSFVKGRLSIFDLHHLIGTPRGTEHVVEHHEMGLFTHDEMTAAFVAAELDVAYDSDGLTGRGLYVARAAV